MQKGRGGCMYDRYSLWSLWPRDGDCTDRWRGRYPATITNGGVSAKFDNLDPTI